MILRDSGIIGIVISFLSLIYWGEEFGAGVLIGGLIATGLILNRKLKGEEWGIFVGIIFTIVIFDLMLTLFSLTGLSG